MAECAQQARMQEPWAPPLAACWIAAPEGSQAVQLPVLARKVVQEDLRRTHTHTTRCHVGTSPVLTALRGACVQPRKTAAKAGCCHCPQQLPAATSPPPHLRVQRRPCDSHHQLISAGVQGANPAGRQRQF